MEEQLIIIKITESKGIDIFLFPASKNRNFIFKLWKWNWDNQQPWEVLKNCLMTIFV